MAQLLDTEAEFDAEDEGIDDFDDETVIVPEACVRSVPVLVASPSDRLGKKRASLFIYSFLCGLRVIRKAICYVLN